MPGEFRRVNRGSGHGYTLDGEALPGVTSILDSGVPKPALISWAANETAAYAVNNWGDLAVLPVAERLKALERGRWEKQKAATARGTTIHAYAARLLGGDEVDVPDDVADAVDQCLAFLRDWNVAELFVEAAVLNREYRYAGTVDLIAQIGTDVWLLDWKTGASGIWPETALQLSAYAACETILDDVAGFEVPLPHVQHAAGVWIRADGYEVHEVDITAPTFRTFLYVQQVAAWVDRPRADTVGPPLPPPFARAAS